MANDNSDDSSSGADIAVGLANWLSNIQANQAANEQNQVAAKWGPLMSILGGKGPQYANVPNARFSKNMVPALVNAYQDRNKSNNNNGTPSFPGSGSLVNYAPGSSSPGPWAPQSQYAGPDNSGNLANAAGGGDMGGSAYCGGGYDGGGDPSDPDSSSSILPLLAMMAPGGGAVPGMPNTPGNSPTNDTQLTMTSPGETILPRSITKDGNKGNMWKVAAYMNEVKKHGPGPLPIGTANKISAAKNQGQLSPWKAMAGGGKLTASDRNHIAPSNFALPGKRYPIEDANHARNALSRVSQFGSPEEKSKVRAKVHSKFPGIGGH